MRTLLQDIKFGSRALAKNPGFTAVAVLALALGVGANSAIFSVVNATLLNPLPFPEEGQLLRLGEGARGGAQPERGSVSYPDYKDVQAQTRTLAHVSAFLNSGAMLTGEGFDQERVYGADVSPEYFDVLGVRPELGRVFTAEEDRPNSGVVVISHSLWQRRFGGRADVLGQQLRMRNAPATVIGVMPSGFEYPFRADRQDFWEPLNDRPLPDREQRDSHGYRVIARMKPGVTIEQANAELDTISRRLEQQYPDSNATVFVAAASMHEEMTRDVRPALLILLGAVGLVLLIACANVANLLLARAAGRQKEIAIRTALGASRWRVVRQLLVESLLLALAGGAAGLLLGWWGLDLMKGLLPAGFPRAADIGVDPRVLAFTLLVSCATGVLFGLAPALQFTKPDVHAALKESARGSTAGGRSGRLRGLLIVSEVALSLVLLAGAGLLFRSLMRLQSVELGFRPQRVLTFRLTPSGSNFREDAQYSAFFRDVAERVRNIPGVEAVGVINTLPLAKGPTTGFRVEGRPASRPDQWPSVNYRSVSPEYFRAVGVSLLRGRAPDERDSPASPPVLVVNEALARRDFPGEDPVGKRISFGVRPGGEPYWFQIVGVVADVRSMEVQTEPPAEIYTSYLQDPFAGMSYVVRSTVEPESLAPAVREAVRSVDRAQPVAEFRTLENLVGEAVAEPRLNSILLGLFAGLALALAAAGIYGVMSYAVTQRTHEIGIRIALGAQGRDVLRFVVGQGMALAAAGVGLGLVASFAVTRLMSGLLYGVSPSDPATLAFVSLTLLSVALAACIVPARRAMKVDPMVALRHE